MECEVEDGEELALPVFPEVPEAVALDPPLVPEVADPDDVALASPVWPDCDVAVASPLFPERAVV